MSDSSEEKDTGPGTEDQAAAQAEHGPSAASGTRSGGRGPALLALLVALLAGAAGGWAAWQQWQANRGGDDLGARLDRLERKVARENADRGGRLDKLSESLDQLASSRGAGAGELKQLEQRVADAESAARQAADAADGLSQRLDALEQSRQTLADRLDRLAARMPESGPSPVAALDLAQAEFLIRAGYRSLALDADAPRAVKALEMADEQLAGVDAPGVAAARGALSDELEALRAVPEPDVTGLASRLASLAGRVDELPFPGPRPPRGTPGGGESGRGWWGATQSFLGDYFTVRRTTESGAGMAAPEARQGTREVLRLELEQARLALLRSDDAVYRASLERAANLLRQRFDAGSNAVKQALESLDELSAANIAPELPRTGAALERVREARRRLEDDGG